MSTFRVRADLGSSLLSSFADLGPPHFLAIEAQAFSLRVPEHFFSMYSPVRSDATARAERDRLMEDIRFVAKSVRFHSSPIPRVPFTHTRHGQCRSPTCASR
jgi:hypothetical protein